MLDFDDFAGAVASELRAERGRAQVTVAFLVEATGLSKSAVLHYLNGKRDIPIRALARLCAAMAVMPSLIVARAEAALNLEPAIAELRAPDNGSACARLPVLDDGLRSRASC